MVGVARKWVLEGHAAVAVETEREREEEARRGWEIKGRKERRAAVVDRDIVE